MPIISVIVPIYNVEQYVSKCVESFLSQTYKDFELILVDDGSQDQSGAICDEYAEKDKRVRVVHKQNGGVSSARNAGLDVASGEYIMFCDGDDYVKSDCLEVMKNALEDGNYDVVNMQFLFVNGAEAISVTSYKIFEKVFTEKKEKWNHIVNEFLSCTYGWEVWTRIMKRELIEKYSIRFCTTCENFAEDLAFSLEYLLYARKIKSIDYAGYCYVQHAGSMMDSSKGNVRLNPMNEVSAYLAPVYNRVLGREYKKLYPIVHFWLMYNEYKKVVLTTRYSELQSAHQLIQNKRWQRKQFRKLRKCRNYFKERYGEYSTKRLMLFARYCIHGNWKRFTYESAIAYKWFIKP